MKIDLAKFKLTRFQNLKIEDNVYYYAVISSPVLYDRENDKCLKDISIVVFLVKLQLKRWKESSDTQITLPKQDLGVAKTIGIAKSQGVFLGKNLKKKMSGVKSNSWGYILEMPKRKLFGITRLISENWLRSNLRKAGN